MTHITQTVRDLENKISKLILLRNALCETFDCCDIMDTSLSLRQEVKDAPAGPIQTASDLPILPELPLTSPQDRHLKYRLRARTAVRPPAAVDKATKPAAPAKAPRKSPAGSKTPLLRAYTDAGTEFTVEEGMKRTGLSHKAVSHWFYQHVWKKWFKRTGKGAFAKDSGYPQDPTALLRGIHAEIDAKKPKVDDE